MEITNLFQMDFVLSLDDRMGLISSLKETGNKYPQCSLCGSGVDIAFMRKKTDAPLHEAMCLPCFLQNHTSADQKLIDKVVAVGETKGFYYD